MHVGYRGLVARLSTLVCEIFGEGEIERLNGAHGRGGSSSRAWSTLGRKVVLAVATPPLVEKGRIRVHIEGCALAWP